MEEDLRYCPNKRCARKNITIYAPDFHYCKSCGAKMKTGWGKDNDSPPLIDDRPQFYRGSKIRAITTPQRNEDKMENLVIMGKEGREYPTEPVSWAKFKGTWQDHEAYMKEWTSGKFERFSPWGEEISVTTARGEDTFTCSDPDVEGCPLISREKKSYVNIPYLMYQEWKHLAGSFDTEWIAYLKGTQDADSKAWTITEYYFPKQKANGAHVDAEDGEIVDGTIGSVHSHVRMSAFFSTEDKKHFNHPVEMVINANGDMAICVRLKLDCGKMSRVECKGTLIDCPDHAAIRAALRDKLVKEETTVIVQGYRGKGYN